ATFSMTCVRAVVAGDEPAAEDDAAGGERDLRAQAPGPDDVVVGVSASGRTPYVLGAIGAARAAGALTVALVSTTGSELARVCDREILVVVGPEVLAGSTRLKAG